MEQAVSAKTVAVVIAALTAGGYLSPEEQVRSIKKTNQKMDTWKYSWLMEITTGSDSVR